MQPSSLFLVPLLACGVVAACAGDAGAPPGVSQARAADATRDWRVLVKLAAPSVDTAAIARQATDTSGVPVRYAASSSSDWHALTLSCPDDASCLAAMQRLQAASTTYRSVQRDERRRIMSPY